MSANIPAVVENRLDAVSITDDDRILLASSNLTGRYWNGSLWYFDSVETAPFVEKCLSGIEASAGICDMAYIDKTRIALGLDSGGVEVFQIDEPNVLAKALSSCEHDDYVTSVSATSDKASLVSAGADRCIKVWDTTTWSSNATFRPVHGGIIWQVACSSEEPNVFVTCGQDGRVLLFDLRLPKPASVLDSSFVKGAPTAVCWRGGDVVAVGDESGAVAVKDLRQNGCLSSYHPHTRRIHRMAIAPSEPWLATCADSTEISVTDVSPSSTPVEMYRDDSHEDFVRGLAWTSKKELVSCGWDKKVLSHTIL